MYRTWSEVVYDVVLSLLVLMLVFSGIDTYFDASGSLNFFPALGLNAVFLLGGSLSIFFAFIIFFLFFDGTFSDKTSTIFSYIFSGVCLYLLKYSLIAGYDLVFSIEPLIIAGEVLAMALPLFFITKALKQYGRGFQH